MSRSVPVEEADSQGRFLLLKDVGEPDANLVVVAAAVNRTATHSAQCSARIAEVAQLDPSRVRATLERYEGLVFVRDRRRWQFSEVGKARYDDGSPLARIADPAIRRTREHAARRTVLAQRYIVVAVMLEDGKRSDGVRQRSDFLAKIGHLLGKSENPVSRENVFRRHLAAIKGIPPPFRVEYEQCGRKKLPRLLLDDFPPGSNVDIRAGSERADIRAGSRRTFEPGERGHSSRVNADIRAAPDKDPLKDPNEDPPEGEASPRQGGSSRERIEAALAEKGVAMSRDLAANLDSEGFSVEEARAFATSFGSPGAAVAAAREEGRARAWLDKRRRDASEADRIRERLRAEQRRREVAEIAKGLTCAVERSSATPPWGNADEYATRLFQAGLSAGRFESVLRETAGDVHQLHQHLQSMADCLPDASPRSSPTRTAKHAADQPEGTRLKETPLEMARRLIDEDKRTDFIAMVTGLGRSEVDTMRREHSDRRLGRCSVGPVRVRAVGCVYRRSAS